MKKKSPILQYFIDLRLIKHKELFKSSFIIILLACLPSIIFLISFSDLIVNMYCKNGLINVKLLSDSLVIIFLSFLFMYVFMLASHIVIKEDYIEYVQYFIKRKTIKIDEIVSCKEIWLKGIARSVEITDKKGNSIVFNYSFCNLSDLKTITTLIGYPNFVRMPDKTNGKKRKKLTKSDKELIKRIISVIVSALIFIGFSFLFFEFIKRYETINNIISKIIVPLAVIGSFALSQLIYNKTKKWKIKKMLFLLLAALGYMALVVLWLILSANFFGF